MFKISTGEAPSYLANDKFSKVEARNPCNIRSNQFNINLPLPKTGFMIRSFVYAGPKLWNSLPYAIKLAYALAAFKGGLENLDFDVLLSYY